MKRNVLICGIFAVILVFSLAFTACSEPSEPETNNNNTSGKTLESIAITTQPTKTVYAKGEAIDLSGLVVTATYSDGTTVTLSISEENISGFDTSTVGTKTVTVTYNGKTATFPITVKELSSIAPPEKTVYAVGEALDLVVTVTYDDGTTGTLKVSPENVSGYDPTTPGEQTITVNYDGKEITFTIILKAISSIAVTTLPTKTVYAIGEALDLNGLVVTATYSDNSTGTLNVSAEHISGFSSATEGTKTVIVTYNGKTATFTVTVKVAVGGKEISSIEITTLPTKTDYVTGDTLDLSGLIVTATYSDGSMGTISVSSENISGFNSTTAGEKTITITCEGKTDTFTITVRVLDGAFNNITDFATWLDAQSPNTAAKPYTVKLNITNTADFTDLKTLLYNTVNKYVYLDLSGSTITSIPNRAFNNYNTLNTLTGIIIPDSVTSIGDAAFSWCAGLTSITIPNSVTSIGGNAFSDCTGLTSINIPDGVTIIKSGTFWGCTNLYSINIPDNITSIGAQAFSNCEGLIHINISASVTNIDVLAFWQCYALAEIEVAAGNTIYSSQDGVLYNKNKTILISCPAGKTGILTIPNGVTTIGAGAFIYCANLTEVIIPSSVTYIEREVFIESGITSITIPDSVTSIGVKAFSSCKNLVNVTIGKGVTSIEEETFRFCYKLTSVIIPNSVTSIGASAFDYCTSLNSISITDNISYIGDYAFNETAWFNNQPNGVIYAGKFVYSYKGTLPANITINSGTKGIVGFAFSSCTDITSITIPNSVSYIGRQAFDGCTGLASVIIPASVTSIERGAFIYCSNLASVTFQGTISSSKFDSSYKVFFGDLRAKFYATDKTNGTPGTYTTTAPVDNNSVWTK